MSPTSDDWTERSNDILVNAPTATSVTVDAADGRMINLLVGNPDSYTSVEGELVSRPDADARQARAVRDAGRGRSPDGDAPAGVPAGRPRRRHRPRWRVDPGGADSVSVDVRRRPGEHHLDDDVDHDHHHDDCRRPGSDRCAGRPRRGVQPRRRGHIDEVVDRAPGEPARTAVVDVELDHSGADGEPPGDADPADRASRRPVRSARPATRR